MTFVEVRAFRGTRQSSVYRCCVLPEWCVSRMRRVAVRLRLAALGAALEALESPRGELPKEAARALAQDADTLRVSGELLELDAELAELANVANWCSRAPSSAWLTVRRRRPAA